VKLFSIKENAFIAKIAAKKLRSKNAAIVLGSRIYLYGVSKSHFLANRQWLRHELKHIEQYERLGFIGFVFTYLWQTMRVGYYKCGLECEAREAEKDETIISRFTMPE